MNFDIVFVTYNSEKWIEGCFKSIVKSEYDLSNISIIVVDNNSGDSTVEKLNMIKENLKTTFNGFTIIESSENLGFGKGNNLGFKQGNSPYVFFLNIDTEIKIDTLMELKKYIDNAEARDGVWELRQFPYEHPKLYNPMTLNTSWFSGAAFAIRRDVFEEVNGFDEHIFMYAEDVDLSWRIRTKGYKIKYAPRAIVHHYCYAKKNEIKPNQYFNSLINNLLLRYKFAGPLVVLKGYAKFAMLMLKREPFKNARIILISRFLKHFFQIGPYVEWRFKNRRELRDFKPRFYGWDYETIRDGAFYTNELPEGNPLVSVIVRTCGRPDMLRETLISLKNQTYRNIEIVIVEDGENISEEMINKEFWNLNIVYTYTVEKVGRSKTGNLALEMAKGKYLNFLDDDDVFYADHIEVLVRQLEKNKDYRAAYSLAFETPINIISRSPYEYDLTNFNLTHKQSFNKILLFHHNYLPIQCIMFEKDIYLEEGGIDESLDVLEDWDLWVRYACKNDFLYVEKVTSKYRVPQDAVKSEDRQKLFDDALVILRKKHSEYSSKVNVLQTAEDIQDIYGSFVFALSKESANKMYSKHPHISKIAIKFLGLLRRLLKRVRR